MIGEEFDRDRGAQESSTISRSKISELLRRFDEADAFDRLNSIDDQPDIEIVEVLGEGGMGTVFRVFDKKIGREAAMKVVRRDDSVAGRSSERERARLIRLVREARIVGKLNHPGVLPIYSIGRHPEHGVYFTMAIDHGVSLSEIFDSVDETAAMGLQRFVGIMIRVAETVAHAHSHDIIHRDLKPGNILIGDRGEVRVIDWGLACRLEDSSHEPMHDDARNGDRDRSTEVAEDMHTMTGDVLGTPGYMAPEQARGERAAVGRHSDVYALGALLYRFLSGRRPHDDAERRLDHDALAARQRSALPESIHKIAAHHPVELRAICEKAMQPEIFRRYSTAEELRLDLQRFVEGRAVSAYRQGILGAVGDFLRRRRRGVVLVVIIIAVVGAAVLIESAPVGRISRFRASVG